MFKSKRYAVVMALILSASVSMAFAHDPKKGGMQGMSDKGKMTHMDSMSDMKMTGDQDYDFAMMMRAHHKQALPMASKEIKEGKNADMRRMAQSIFDAQTKEISQFDTWISAHKAAMPASKP